VPFCLKTNQGVAAMTMTRAEEVLLNETFKKIGQNIHNNRI